MQILFIQTDCSLRFVCVHVHCLLLFDSLSVCFKTGVFLAMTNGPGMFQTSSWRDAQLNICRQFILSSHRLNKYVIRQFV